MYTLRIKDKFDAAHMLEGIAKKCENLHGHTFHVEVEFRYNELNEHGVAEDFVMLKKLVREVTDSFDHKYLNSILEQPTSERVAKMIYGLLKKQNNKVYKVTVWETESAGVEYYED